MGLHNGIQLFVSDVDGTLLNAQKELTEKTHQAIRKLQLAGVAVSLVSSRPPKGLRWLLDELEIQHACAALNGGVIIKPDLEVLSSYIIRGPLLEAIVTVIEEEGLAPWVYTESEWFVRNVGGDHVAHEAAVVRFVPEQLPTLSKLRGAAIKITGISDNEATIMAAQNRLSHEFGEEISLSCSLPNRLEITHHEANKGTAVTAIAATMEIAPQHIATAGDGENDILMFRNSGFSIAMGQAPDEVRRAATQTTTSNFVDGLAWAIEQFLLKPQ